eukprot:gene13527-18147_t
MEFDRFQRYEENFLNSSRIISRCMMQLDSSGGNVDVVITASVEIDGELSEAEGYLRAMEVEFRTMASSDKRTAQQKLTDYKEEYRQLQQHYQSSKFNAESAALKSGSAARTKLLSVNQRLDQSTATLEQSRQILAQTEQIGTTIITDLESQKEKLMEARSNVKDTRDITNEARQVLKIMGNRALIHKLCVVFTIIVLLGGIIAVAYFGFIKK